MGRVNGKRRNVGQPLARKLGPPIRELSPCWRKTVPARPDGREG